MITELEQLNKEVLQSKHYPNSNDSPPQFLYKACPRCKEGTLYSPPQMNDFSCIVCGWTQKCRYCFGDVIAQGLQKVCTGCNKNAPIKSKALWT